MAIRIFWTLSGLQGHFRPNCGRVFCTHDSIVGVIDDVTSSVYSGLSDFSYTKLLHKLPLRERTDVKNFECNLLIILIGFCYRQLREKFSIRVWLGRSTIGSKKSRGWFEYDVNSGSIIILPLLLIEIVSIRSINFNSVHRTT
ncbi:hypothetical protein PNOK_0558400 [Pyrrhoderma noxium]|uniref:Uncharacterized protein n=1 Tax=Pyrrhoderma noxium TaxID=2282107 RepID=A0A286UGK8_9AGAM|nr:hypothetical protein PNOK_0558400 [Pyrrhoderma noxium]